MESFAGTVNWLHRTEKSQVAVAGTGQELMSISNERNLKAARSELLWGPH